MLSPAGPAPDGQLPDNPHSNMGRRSAPWESLRDVPYFCPEEDDSLVEVKNAVRASPDRHVSGKIHSNEEDALVEVVLYCLMSFSEPYAGVYWKHKLNSHIAGAL